MPAMTTPPLPDVSCVRVALDYSHDSGLKGGSRFYLKYGGTAPTSADCISLATGVGTAWNAELAGTMNVTWGLTEIDVLDITTYSGSSGTHGVSYGGTATGTAMPAQTAMGVEYSIARRYRGGKPRMYLPPAVAAQTDSDTTWSTGWVSTVQAAVTSFFSQVEALTVGGMGTLTHINLSYYTGFKNVENTSGRMRAAPVYRATAKSDTVTGYVAKREISSQRRRRVSTSY